MRKMTRAEKVMKAYIEEYYNAMWNGEEPDGEKWCLNCPVREECDNNEMYFGCGIWEDNMGEDL